MHRYLVAAVAALGLAVLAVPAEAARTVYRGQWQCDDRGTIEPLGGIELQLWRRGSPDFLPVEWVGGIDDRGFAAPDGTFSLTATDGEDNHFVRMALRDDAGVHLKDFWGINDWSIDSGGTRNDVPVRDLGGLLFSTPGQSHKCAVWRGFHLAHRDFRDLMGFNPPSGGLLINADAITSGVPFTPHTTIMWPGGFPVGYAGGGDDSITRHEFGHVIRHGYDGDFGHFLGDVVTHNYLQNHEPCNKTGLGFAFNEGWAEYWARDYGPAPACPGRVADDYEVEGNVAAALTDLEVNCLGSRAAMVNILRANPGLIHSFQEFRAHVACPAPLVVTSPLPLATTALGLSAAQRAALARSQVRAVDADLRRLRGSLSRADRRARNVVACERTPCNAALRRAMELAVLRTEIALAGLVRDTVDDLDSVREQQAAGKLTIASATRRMKAVERANRIRAAKASADGLRDVLAASGPVFARDKSRATRRLRSRLMARLGAFRKAQRSASAVPGLALNQAVVDRIRRVQPQPFPNPEPPQVLDPRQISTLTITCPAATGKVGGIEAVSGTLSPPVSGAALAFHLTSPSAAEAVQSIPTDPTGAFATSVSTPTSGTYTFFARWAGNGTVRPDDSPSCQIVVP